MAQPSRWPSFRRQSPIALLTTMAALLTFITAGTIGQAPSARASDSAGVPARAPASGHAADPAAVGASSQVRLDGSSLHPLVPTRVLDTRNGTGAPVGKVGPGKTITVQVTGRGSVPTTGVGAVVLNVTATAPTQPSYITVYPTGASRPTASNLNVTASQTIPNLVVAKVGTNGKITLYNYQGSTHLIADVAGWFSSGTESSMIMDLPSTTVLAGAGDVMAITGNSNTAAQIVLTASADIPPVGGHLVVMGGPLTPQGYVGEVTATSAQAGGLTGITAKPAAVADAFTRLQVKYDGAINPGVPITPHVTPRVEPHVAGYAEPRAMPSPPAAAPLAQRPAAILPGTLGWQFFGDSDPESAYNSSCTASSEGLPVYVGTSIGFVDSSMEFDVDLGIHPKLMFLLSTTPTLRSWATMNGTVSCKVKYKLPTKVLVPGTPLVLEFAGMASAEASGEVSFSSEVAAPVQIGFQVDGTQVTNLSSASFTGTSTHDIRADATLFAGVRVETKLFDRAGVYLEAGPQMRASFILSDIDCAQITVGLRVGAGVSVDLWLKDWSWSLGTTTVFEHLLAQSSQNCPGKPWTGTISFTRSTSWGDSANMSVILAADGSQTWSGSLHESYGIFGDGCDSVYDFTLTGDGAVDSQYGFGQPYWDSSGNFVMPFKQVNLMRSTTPENPPCYGSGPYEFTWPAVCSPESFSFQPRTAGVPVGTNRVIGNNDSGIIDYENGYWEQVTWSWDLTYPGATAPPGQSSGPTSCTGGF